MGGMTLIEVIGVLTVLAILLSLALPAVLKTLDKAAGDLESSRLKSFSEAYLNRSLRLKYVPGTNDWAANIATELGLAVTEVARNARDRARVFLIDAGNGISLPYAQATTGAPGFSGAARVMILSSLGPALPFSTGILSTNDFSTIWNTSDGVVPSATVFAGWAGRGEDLKVQRINLGASFIHLVLNYYSSVNPAWYSTDTNVSRALVSGVPYDSFLLKSTVLNLCSGNNTNMEAQQILNADSSYWFYQDSWRGSLPGAVGVAGASGTNLIGAFDFSAIVSGFLQSPRYTTNSPTQTQIVQALITYMDAYGAWAGAGFPASGATWTAVTAAQTAMRDNVNNLNNSLPH